MLPDEGRICETEVPPWRTTEQGHRILCHIPLDDLKTLDAVIHMTTASV
jgi:peptide/nickel transport system ATP-binding protein